MIEGTFLNEGVLEDLGLWLPQEQLKSAALAMVSITKREPE